VKNTPRFGADNPYPLLSEYYPAAESLQLTLGVECFLPIAGCRVLERSLRLLPEGAPLFLTSWLNTDEIFLCFFYIAISMNIFWTTGSKMGFNHKGFGRIPEHFTEYGMKCVKY
jgi:hypothetical protein